jgi:hypothetical protein
MKVTLLGVYDRGVISKERVHFRADVDLNLSFFIVLDSFWIDATNVQAGYRAGYWFAPHSVKKSENVVLYTRAGTPSTEEHSDGATYHFVFRGNTEAAYTTPKASAIVMEINTWISTPAVPTVGSLLSGLAAPPLPPMTLGDYFKSDLKK